MQSGNSQAAPSLNHQDSALAAADTRGRHRITAELKRLEQEARFLEVGPLLLNYVLFWFSSFCFALFEVLYCFLMGKRSDGFLGFGK